MNGSGILEEVLHVTKCKYNEASHFAVCNGNRIKFFIHLSHGLHHLRRSVAAYNKKLAFLLLILPLIPWRLLQWTKLGYFAKLTLHPSVADAIPGEMQWNIFIGTYDRAQKLVFQCFSRPDEKYTFVKVGNKGSSDQMEREIRFLQKVGNYQNFSTPKLLHSTLLSEGAAFNILVTDEFEGTKTPPTLNEDIFRVAQEIAGEPTIIDGVVCTFSHGDFAPWNIRKNDSSYTVFDWEHCGMRPIGYDMAYFVIMTEIALKKRSFDEAYSIAMKQLHHFNPQFVSDKQLFRQEFVKTTKTLQF